MNSSIYQNLHTETFREANRLLEFEADELGVSVERLIGIKTLGLLSEITHELLRKKYEERYVQAKTEQEKDEILTAFLKETEGFDEKLPR